MTDVEEFNDIDGKPLYCYTNENGKLIMIMSKHGIVRLEHEDAIKLAKHILELTTPETNNQQPCQT